MGSAIARGIDAYLHGGEKHKPPGFKVNDAVSQNSSTETRLRKVAGAVQGLAADSDRRDCRATAEVYRFTYFVKGLFVSSSGEILERDTHVLEINLTLGYPRRAPQCRLLNPIFHPNFDESTVCIGDFWAASEELDDLVVRIGRMIAYQEYNTKSPLNGLAAKWAAQHAGVVAGRSS